MSSSSEDMSSRKATARHNKNTEAGRKAKQEFSTKQHQPKSRKPCREWNRREMQSVPYYPTYDTKSYLRKRKRDVQDLLEHFQWNIHPNTHTKEKLSLMRGWEFKLLSITPYCQLDSNELPERSEKDVPTFPPAEVALVAFSMENGITNIYHALITTNEAGILGNKFVKDSADYESVNKGGHQIPISPSRDIQDEYRFTSDYHRVLNEITNLCTNDKYIFIVNQEFNQVVGGINWLLDEALIANSRAPKAIDPQRLVVIEDLLKALLSLPPHKLPEDIEDLMDLLNPHNSFYSVFDDNQRTVCKFHIDHHTRNCALARAQKCLYGLFEALQKAYIFQIDVKHMPYIEAISLSGHSWIASEPSTFLERPPPAELGRDRATGNQALTVTRVGINSLLIDRTLGEMETPPPPRRSMGRGVNYGLKRAPVHLPIFQQAEQMRKPICFGN